LENSERYEYSQHFFFTSLAALTHTITKVANNKKLYCQKAFTRICHQKAFIKSFEQKAPVTTIIFPLVLQS